MANVIVELSLINGESFVIGDCLPIAGQITLIERYADASFRVYASNKSCNQQVYIDIPCNSICRSVKVNEEDVAGYLSNRDVVMSDFRRQTKEGEALEGIVGPGTWANSRPHIENPR